MLPEGAKVRIIAEFHCMRATWRVGKTVLTVTDSCPGRAYRTTRSMATDGDLELAIIDECVEVVELPRKTGVRRVGSRYVTVSSPLHRRRRKR